MCQRVFHLGHTGVHFWQFWRSPPTTTSHHQSLVCESAQFGISAFLSNWPNNLCPENSILNEVGSWKAKASLVSFLWFSFVCSTFANLSYFIWYGFITTWQGGRSWQPFTQRKKPQSFRRTHICKFLQKNAKFVNFCKSMESTALPQLLPACNMVKCV